MLKFFLRIFLIFVISQCETLLAVIVHYPEDLERSKQECVVSGVPRAKLEQDTKGVMTLCFKKQEESRFEHVALTFEMFLDSKPHELILRMPNYAREASSCWLGRREYPRVDDASSTLTKTLRAKRIYVTDRPDNQIPPTYTRYASWVISNEKLQKALQRAEEDEEKGDKFRGSHTCVTYAVDIMRIAGVQVRFGALCPRTPNNLKWLVDHAGTGSHWIWGEIQPAPDYKENELPRNPYLENR